MIKSYLPKTLFMRGLLIVVLPILLIQIVTAYMFYVRHWQSVTRHMGNALAGEIAFLAYQANKTPPGELESLAWIFEKTTLIDVEYLPGASLAQIEESHDFPDFEEVLATRIDLPFRVVRMDDEDAIEIRFQVSDGTLVLKTTSKRLESGTTLIFSLWTTGSSLVLVFVALIFFRNQVRPIRELAQAAERFGKGHDTSRFKPSGALEVRRAARAFLIMRDRIERQIRTRTEMLAGISHDLRTPLTRMKLGLALLGDTAGVKGLEGDVQQMERMIAEYLDFARGDGGEEAVSVSVSEALSDIIDDYRRQGRDIPCTVTHEVQISVRRGAFVRMMHNIIDNALRYGNECRVQAQLNGGRLEIQVEDKGPGIPPEHRVAVFRPFTRLDASRNLNSGGVGLGLSIAQDVARRHGGSILLGDAPGGGLRVTVRLPV